MDKYHRWTVLEKMAGIKWLCCCECGAERMVSHYSLKSGMSKSCGCLHSDRLSARNTKHGMGRHPLYGIWKGMTKRCRDPHPRYGGRGISVCDAWKDSFDVFRQWAESNGWQKGLEIDRENNDGNYEPDNCRFITKIENTRNSSRTKLKRESVLAIFRSDEPTSSLSARYGVGGKTIRNIKRGKSWKDVTMAEFSITSN